MKKQALALAIASALVSPSAFAATDTSGMQFTSASEGFYASLRAMFHSGGSDAATSQIQSNSNRIGVRGSNDLGGGLEGFYQWEAQIGITDGQNARGGHSHDADNNNSVTRGSADGGNNFRTRLGVVGLRGAFGQIQAGSFWTQDYNWTHGATDVANVQSGYLNYTDQREARSERSLEYSTPDLNGFQGAFLVKMDNGVDEDNDLDSWNLAAKYEVQGFTIAGSYNVVTDGVNTRLETAAIPFAPGFPGTPGTPGTPAVPAVQAADHECRVADADGNVVEMGIWDPASGTEAECAAFNDLDADGGNDGGGTDVGFYVAAVEAADEIPAVPGIAAIAAIDAVDAVPAVYTKDDLDSWTVRLGYAQDNWYVNGWYGEDSYSDGINAAEEALEDQELFSIAAGVAVDKVNVYGVYEVSDNTAGATGVEDTRGTVGVQYNLGSQSRVWIEYASIDLESNKDADDYVTIGLQHSF